MVYDGLVGQLGSQGNLVCDGTSRNAVLYVDHSDLLLAVIAADTSGKPEKSDSSNSTMNTKVNSKNDSSLELLYLEENFSPNEDQLQVFGLDYFKGLQDIAIKYTSLKTW